MHTVRIHRSQIEVSVLRYETENFIGRVRDRFEEWIGESLSACSISEACRFLDSYHQGRVNLDLLISALETDAEVDRLALLESVKLIREAGLLLERWQSVPESSRRGSLTLE